MRSGGQHFITGSALEWYVRECRSTVELRVDRGGAGRGVHHLELRDLAVDDAAAAARVLRKQGGVDERAAAFCVDDEVIRSAVAERHRVAVVDHLLAVGQRRANFVVAGVKRRGIRGRRVGDVAEIRRHVVERHARSRHIQIESAGRECRVRHDQQKFAAARNRGSIGQKLRRGSRRCAVDEIRVFGIVDQQLRRIDDRRSIADGDLDFLIARIGVLISGQPFERQRVRDGAVADSDRYLTAIDDSVEYAHVDRLAGDEAAAF